MLRYHLTVLLATAASLWAQDNGFVSLFNGRDLSGWVNVNCAPETWSVRDGLIHCTGRPTGALRTARQYQNFVLELEWRHLSSGGNSGVFIWATPIAAPGVPFLRGIEVQVLDNGFNVSGKNQWYTTHGDVFPIHGATMEPFGRHNGMRSFPSEERSKSSPEWNQYRITCQDGVIRLAVNGRDVSGGQNCNYRKGYIGLESEGGPIDFRNIRMKELPGAGVPAELSAPEDQGWHSLFTGLDLRGWATNSAAAQRWTVRGEMIVSKDGPSSPDATLWTDREFGDASFVADCRLAKGSKENRPLAVYVRGVKGRGVEVPLGGAEPGVFHRFEVAVKGQAATVSRDGKPVQAVALPSDTSPRGAFGLATPAESESFMNLYVRELH